jgi:trans-2-enoyl-CoA reductase
MRRAIALCLRYLKLLQQQRDKGVNKDSINLRKRPIRQCVRVTASSNKFIPKERITVEQIQEAETRIIKTLKNDLFEDEIKKLKSIEALQRHLERPIDKLILIVGGEDAESVPVEEP